MTKNWVAQVKELLSVLEKNSIVTAQATEACLHLYEGLEMTSNTTHLVKYYKDPRAVVVSIETSEAVRQPSLLISSFIESTELQDEVEPITDETTISTQEWATVVEEAIKITRAEPKSRNSRLPNFPSESIG